MRITGGDWVPPALTDAQAQATAGGLLALPASGPLPNRIVEVNGFRIGGGETPDVKSYPCPIEQLKRVPGGESPLGIAYVPANALQTYEPYVVSCPDGAIQVTAMMFRVSGARIDRGAAGNWPEAILTVRYVNTERVSPEFVYPSQHVEAGVVNARPAVFIKPVVEEGVGPSTIYAALRDGPQGYLMVSAENLPFEELLKVAQGVQCALC